jgi:hypothetical protein
MLKHAISFDDNSIDQQTLSGNAAFVPSVYAGSAWLPGASAMSAFMPVSPAGTAVVVSTPGSGLVFDNTYAAGCTAPYEACIVAAEHQLESLFTNTDTISVTFNEQNEGANDIALENNSPKGAYSYAQLKAALLKVAPGDVLPAADPSKGGTWLVPNAYARMLGLTTATGSDVTLTLNTYYPWQYGQDVINGITHELTEGGLGRIGYLGTSGTGPWGTMDLFRYNAAGQADYSNGRDGDTTYFSSNGGATLSDQNLPAKGAPTLSYNNQYNTSGVKVNGGDTADWSQNYVFGSTGDGETLALTQTELQVMQALGWHLSLKQDVDAHSGAWETPTAWSTGSMPIEAQDVYLSSADVTLDSNVIVNSIATSASSILSIGDATPTTLTAVDGTNLNSEDASFTATGNLGDIAVYTGSALQIGYFNETFDNMGAMLIGKGAGGSGAGDLNIAGTIDLNGAGTLTLGTTGTTGDILNAAGLSGSGLMNVNNTITGSGLIELGSFDNQSGGKIEDQGSLQISAGTFTNEGAITAEAGATLDFGQDGVTQSLANTGSVDIDKGADLAISSKFSVTGSGLIGFKGAGAEITSDGKAATFTNASSIIAVSSGQIGDAGIKSYNDLSFTNTGSVIASGSGVTLTLNTGANTISASGGVLEAESNATLVIGSKINLGAAATIAASTGGTALVSGALSGSGTLLAGSGAVVDLAGGGSFGGAISGAGTVLVSGASAMSFLGNAGGTGTLEIGAGATLSLGLGDGSGQTIDFLGTTGALDLSNPLDFAGTIDGFGGSDQILLQNTSVTSFAFSNNLLTVKDGSATVASLHITDTSNLFSLTAEAHGTLITFG